MSKNPAADSLLALIPAIMARWEQRVRAEVAPATHSDTSILRDDLAPMLEVMAKVLADETDPRTAARDLGFMSVHGHERANQTTYSVGALLLEFHILQETVFEFLEPDQLLDARDRSIVIQYFNELMRVAGDEFSRVQQALQERANHLARIDRAKDEFLAMLGHELRNPLGAISTALFVLQGSGDPAAQQGALAVASRQALHMKRMLDDLLDLARINDGKVVLQLALLDLGTEVQHALQVAQTLFNIRKHSVSLSQPAARLLVMADHVRLGQCLANLLANAAKYTNVGGHIEVVVERDGASAVVRVRDNGVGIAEDLLESIFDVFEQAPRAVDRREGGLGLGLTIVRRLIEQHGGSVEARSQGPGQGSEFILRLPALESVPATLPQHGERGDRLTVLIVEDNVDAADMMARALEMLGHHVVIAHDGPTALAAVVLGCPDVGLLDIGLPGMSGYELATQLRSSGWCSDTIELIAVTGYAADDETLSAAGFDRHLLKPVDVQALEEILASVAASRGMSRRKGDPGVAPERSG